VNYLLDTHTVLWALQEPEKLSRRVVELLNDEHNNFFVSAISIWEISLKFSLGKLNIGDVIPNEIPNLATMSGFKFIALSVDESSTYHQLILTHHKDPFDRMLIWQAMRQNLTLISTDKTVSQYQQAGLKVFW